MYPNYLESPSDLVPLPRCDGPKLKPFDFQGPQKIEFLEYLGWGLHSHVFKVKVLGKIYALKLFRFFHDNWLAMSKEAYREDDLQTLTAFAEFSEPFYAECRAFGRLLEAGREDLAVGCFGYVLLSDESEAAMRESRKGKYIGFDGDSEGPFLPGEMRGRFVGEDGKLPPIWGILKEYGQSTPHEDLRERHFNNMRQAVVSLQQLGIVRLDVSERQFINGRITDFSLAITTPHYLLNPELNPHLTPSSISSIEFEAFRHSIADYWEFDEHVDEFNYGWFYSDLPSSSKRGKIKARGIPGGSLVHRRYDLRRKPHRDLFYTYVDPRSYDWEARVADSRPGALRAPGNARTPMDRSNGTRSVGKPKRRRPPVWYYRCDGDRAARLSPDVDKVHLVFEFRDGLFFPTDSPSHADW